MRRGRTTVRSLASAWEPRQLEHLVLAFLDRPEIVEFARRVGLAERLPRPWRPRARAAERELVRVHRREVAWLLRSAAELRLAELPRDPRLDRAVDFELVLADDDAPAPTSAFGPSAFDIDAWRATAVHEVLSGLADGLAALDVAELVPWFLRAPDAWPAASELSAASLFADDCEAGRLLAAHAFLRDGHPAEAAARIAGALRRGVAPRRRWRWYAHLAVAHEEVGGDRLALQSLRIATADSACGIGPRVSALFLALALGDRAGALGAAQRLRDGGHDDGRLQRACAHRVAALEARGLGASWAPADRSTARLFGEWCRSHGDGPVERVCRALARTAGQAG